jgi:Type I restriction enzyme R protein N terminus (HSDR_N)
LDDPHFHEDSVREEIMVRILSALGYAATGPNRIIRGKKLEHPFVTIGSKTKKIELVPDYLLEVDNRFAWVLEAKAPNEKIVESKNVEQAYSYAIHSEVRVPYFALCNGREFVLYHISKPKPIIHFNTIAIPSYWDNLYRLLTPEKVLEYDFSIKKDFGLHLKMLGFYEFEHLIFPDTPIAFITKLQEDLYTFGSGVRYLDSDTYVATFDFNTSVLRQFEGKIPEAAMTILSAPLDGTIKQVNFADALYRVNVDCRVGDKLQENKDEIFLPLWINRILDD